MMAEAGMDGMPDYLTAEPVLPEVSWETGSLGSGVLALRGGDPGVLKAMADCYAKRFRKSWQDLQEGLAVFMVPSYEHEALGVDSNGLVLALGEALRLSVVELAATKLQAGGTGRGGEPDKSFYVGEKAEACLGKRRRGMSLKEVGDWVRRTPADLVVEVEHTHYDEAKRRIYRDAGVAELWEIGTEAGSKTAIIDLQAAGGPELVEASKVVPGVRADGIADALAVLRQVGGLVSFVRAMDAGDPVAEALLDAAGVKGRD